MTFADLCQGLPTEVIAHCPTRSGKADWIDREAVATALLAMGAVPGTPSSGVHVSVADIPLFEAQRLAALRAALERVLPPQVLPMRRA